MPRGWQDSDGLPSLVRARLDGSHWSCSRPCDEPAKSTQGKGLPQPARCEFDLGETATCSVTPPWAIPDVPAAVRTNGSLSQCHSLRHRLSASSRTQTTNILASILLRRTGERSAERPAHASVGTRSHRPLVQRIPQGPDSERRSAVGAEAPRRVIDAGARIGPHSSQGRGAIG